jgi:hypothetical protein
MALALSVHGHGNESSPVLITPECDAPGCGVAGDQYTMVRCRGCGGWFCVKHIAAAEGVTLVRTVRRALNGLAYYQGSCVPCLQARERIQR